MDNISLIPRSNSGERRGLNSFVSFQGPKFELTALAKIGLAVLAALILVWAGLFIWEQRLNNKLNSYDAELQSLISQRNLSLEEKLQSLNTILNVFKNVLDQHVYWTQIFKILETRTLNTVTFKTFVGDASNNSLEMNGSALSYAALAKQVKVLEDTPGVSSVASSNIGLAQDGRVGFTLKVIFDSSWLNNK